MPRISARGLAFLWLSLPACAAPAAQESAPDGDPGVTAGPAGVCGVVDVPRISLSVGTKLQTPIEGQPIDLLVEGHVEGTGGGSLIVDTCDPATGCKSTLALLEVSAPELPDAPVPADALVRIHYFATGDRASGSAGFRYHVVVENLASWGSLSNPVSTTERVWLVAEASAGQSLDVPVAFDPFVISTEKSTCARFFPGQLAIRVGTPEGRGVLVDVGVRGVLDVTGALAGHYTVRNLQYRDDSAFKVRGYWIVGS